MSASVPAPTTQPLFMRLDPLVEPRGYPSESADRLRGLATARKLRAQWPPAQGGGAPGRRRLVHRAGTLYPRAKAVAASTISTTSVPWTKLIRAKQLAVRVSGTPPRATWRRH